MFFAAVLAIALTVEIRITEDGKVTKRISRKGKGPPPKGNQAATIKYVGTLSDGTVFDSPPGPFRFALGRGVIPGWSIGVATMKVGEIANFSIHYDYGYGERGYPPIVPPMSHLMFQIELVSIE
jgi:FKBP-type peptidyl-prolyl cis-trans isomerase